MWGLHISSNETCVLIPSLLGTQAAQGKTPTLLLTPPAVRRAEQGKHFDEDGGSSDGDYYGDYIPPSSGSSSYSFGGDPDLGKPCFKK